MKINILESIKKRQSFKTANAQGYYIGKEYTVKSYDTVIYSDFNGLDLKFYSQTTSKLQKIISEAFFDVDFTKCKRQNAVNGQDFQKLVV